jgi:hypothetical protein
MGKEKIIPDETAVRNIARNYPNADAAEKYRLAQGDTLLRLFKVNSLEELEKMVDTPGLAAVDAVIEKHNAKMKEEGE